MHRRLWSGGLKNQIRSVVVFHFPRRCRCESTPPAGCWPLARGGFQHFMDGRKRGASRKANQDSKRLRLPPGRHRVEFQYTALNFQTPDLIRFRYRLDGMDPDWVDAGTRRSALYSYLPAGDYWFHLTAANLDGSWK